MTPDKRFDIYRQAYKTASIGDAFIGGMMANSINGMTGDQPTFSDAQVAAMETDADRREAKIRAMTRAADTDRGRMSPEGATVLGAGIGGFAGAQLGGALGMMAGNDDRKSKAPLYGGLAGLFGGGALGGYLGNAWVKADQRKRKHDYETLLRMKVDALRSGN